MENILGQQYSIDNPQQICHPTFSEEKHPILPQTPVSHFFEKSI